MDENSRKKPASKGREKRPSFQQAELQNKSIHKNQGESKNELPPSLVSSQFDGSNLPVKKVLLEANKIVKIGMAKEFAIFEKDTKIQNSNETIDNLRKNIIHLQMEYEKLDQDYQNEISCRTEIIKRMEATRNIVESAAKYSSVLAKSINLLEDDKLKLAGFYEVLYNEQKEIEEKHSKVEKCVKELEDLLNTKFAEVRKAQEKIMFENSQTLNELNEKLSIANKKLKIASEENKSLMINTEELKHTIQNLDASLKNKNQILNSQQESINKLKISVKSMKVRNFKYQKLWKKKKKKVFSLKTKNSQLEKILSNTEASYKESLSINQALEKEKNELKNEIERQLAFYQVQQQEWEKRTEELMKNLNVSKTENEKLTISNVELSEKIMEAERKALELLKEKENEKLHSNQLEENNLKILNENQKLKGNNNELYEENNRKNQLILDLESKLKIYDNDLDSEKTLIKKELQKYENLSKSLELQSCELQKKLLLERDRHEKVITEYDNKLENSIRLTNEKTYVLEKQLQERNKALIEISRENEKNTSVIQNLNTELEGLKKSASQKEEMFENLKNEFENMKETNTELRAAVKNEREIAESLRNELDNAKIQLLDLDKKIADERSSNDALKAEKNQMEKTIGNLRKEIERERKSSEQLKQIKAKLDEKLIELKKMSSENSELKTSMTDLKRSLEEAEARVEAFRVIIKKLEAEKNESRNKHAQEISKLKLDLSLLQEKVKKDENFSNLLNAERNFNEHLESEATEMKQTKENADASPFFQRLDNKEGKATPKGKVNLNESSTTPVQNSKRFLSTPRKVLSAIPQSRLRYSTPSRKEKDPYDFDSDGSVESFDPNQVLKVFNPHMKKETSKRQKVKSIY